MDYIAELDNIKEWIKNLIIIQYRQSKKNRALIDLLVELIFANNLILQIRDLCLSVDKSVGVQLDVVGKWVGVDRYYKEAELWEHPYLSFFNYSEIPNLPDNFDPSDLDPNRGGFSTYSNFEDNNGGFLTYKDWQDTRTAVNKLGDEIFRELIKLKIIKNSINHTQKNIDKAIYEWSNGHVYTTWTFTLYSLSSITADDDIYWASNIEDFVQENEIKLYGKVSEITANNIIIENSNELEIYNGYYETTTKNVTIDGTVTTVYVYNLSNPMKLTYHYDSEYKNIIDIAIFKNILPCPTGCEIAFEQIV